jgi:hydrogenase-4 component E
MFGLVDPLLVVVLLLNFFLLGTSRLRAVITVSALQGTVLGILSALIHKTFSLQPILVAAISIFIKGVLIPSMLTKAMRDASIRREIEPFIGYIPSLLLGGLATGLAVMFAKTLPLPDAGHSLIVPTGIATSLCGFLILTTRKKAITQVVGYLVLENGIFVMGFALIEAVPFLVELGVLLDLFVGIFVMGIIINHISREFASLDTEHLKRLRE